MYKIACIMGKSSSGKDHIYKALLLREELHLKNIVMYTTRPKRSGEMEGVEYYFTDEETADQMERDGKIIELRRYDTVYGVWKYFTADDGQIDLEQGRYLVIGTLEVYEKFCQYYGKEVVMPIYIEVDDGIRLERALTREKKQVEPKYREMCRRFLADCEDFSEERLKKAGITRRFENNGRIEDCIDEIAGVIASEMLT
ncbi:MAG: hypothetical protein PUF12_03925 [Thermoflexaceae bacterium]|nr:hypothetical protein [Thermoflexaceae bacterium]